MAGPSSFELDVAILAALSQEWSTADAISNRAKQIDRSLGRHLDAQRVGRRLSTMVKSGEVERIDGPGGFYSLWRKP